MLCAVQYLDQPKASSHVSEPELEKHPSILKGMLGVPLRVTRMRTPRLPIMEYHIPAEVCCLHLATLVDSPSVMQYRRRPRTT